VKYYSIVYKNYVLK